MKTRTLLLLLVAIVLGVLVTSKGRAETPPVSVTASAEYVSSYVFRGDKIAGDSIQPSVNLEFGSFYASVWGSRALHRDELNETDYTVGFSIEKLHLDVGLTAYTYDTLSSSWEPYIGFSFTPIENVETSIYAYYDWVLRITTFEGKLVHSTSISQRLSLDTGVSVGNSRGTDLTAYYYWTGGVTLNLQLTEKTSAFGSASYRSASTTDHSRDQRVYTAGLSFSF